MKRFIVALALLPTAALAHPGDHSAIGLPTTLRHLISEPDHIGMLAVAVLVVAVVVYLRKGRSQ